MDEERYADFSQRLHRQVVAERTPVGGVIELTRRCPLRCAHCYNNLPMADPARKSELTLEEHQRIVDEIAEAGCLWLLYTGGEIFARADFLDIYRHARRRGLLVTLFTNGTLLTERLADDLAASRPFSIEITLYGRTRESYERLTGVPGSYDRCRRGIDLLLERKLPLKLKTVVVSLNRHEVFDMKRFAEEELGVEFRFDAMVNPRIDCSLSPLAVRLRPEEVVALDLHDPRRVDAWKGFCDHFTGPVHTGSNAGRLYHCGGGVNSFAIDPRGRLSICTLSHADGYDLRGGSFREGWEGFLRAVRAKPLTRPTKCTTCAIKGMCGMCPANGELESGDPETPVDFLCHVAHLRARVLHVPISPHGECEYCPGGSRHAELERSLAAVNGPATAGRAPARRGADGRTLRVLGASGPAPACGAGGGRRGPGMTVPGPRGRDAASELG
jgi:radical SAM protein with 4Fe4S-binding SPASM domain